MRRLTWCPKPQLDCAPAARLASEASETSTGKLLSAVDPDTLVWSTVIAFRWIHVPPVLYQDPPPPIVPTVHVPTWIHPVFCAVWSNT